MQHGFVRVAAASPKIKVADCAYNADGIIKYIKQAHENDAKLVVFPELCLTGYTCGDLFLQRALLDAAKEQLMAIADRTAEFDILAVIGLPLEHSGKLYNCAAVLHRGEILGIVPKTCIPNYGEFYEMRHFSAAPKENSALRLGFCDVPFGAALLFCCENYPDFNLGIEICEDLWTPSPPSERHALAGATVMANLSASDEEIGKDSYRRMLVRAQSGRLICAYVYACAGEGESTTDLVFAAHSIIAENAAVLNESKTFAEGIIFADIDTAKLTGERRRQNTFGPVCDGGYKKIYFSLKGKQLKLLRKIDPHPFVPESSEELDMRCDEILNIQSTGLKKRLEHTGMKVAVIGVSGGLDSTLALLVTARAFEALKLDKKGIIAITMPCFGTTSRTYENAKKLANCLGVTLREIPIEKSVLLHFSDIGQDMNNHDTAYENAQARERTQVLMDVANKEGGLVVGTGDLSELALGWATYNGDHMSMYAVNSSVPKTLVRHLVKYAAMKTENKELEKVLLDILNTPVSPELLPPDGDEISQRTERIVGPYELHDFFLYYVMRFGFPPSKVLRLAKAAFSDKYDEEFIKKWLKVFYTRFFSQQFKRSCLPDGPRVGSVTLSPRGDWRMPSDASAALWLEEIEKL